MQSIDTSPPWWDGTVAIAFSIEEWETILHELAMLYQIPAFPSTKEDEMVVSIMNKIRENIRIDNGEADF